MSARWDLYGVEPDLWLVGPKGTDEERFIAKINLPADASPALRARRFAEVRVMKAAPELLALVESMLYTLTIACTSVDTHTVITVVNPLMIADAKAALRAAKGEPA